MKRLAYLTFITLAACGSTEGTHQVNSNDGILNINVGDGDVFNGYSSYAQSPIVKAYVDVCAGGIIVNVTDAGVAKKNVVNVPIGFDFWIYHYPATDRFGTPATMNVSWNGLITFGSSPLVVSPPARPWPDNSLINPSPRNVFAPFWDDLSYAGGGELCYQNIGTAPNRAMVIEWRDVTFTHTPDVSAILDFEVFLNETSFEIDTVYNSMLDVTGNHSLRAEGSTALVGMQDSTQTSATSTFQVAQYGSGTAYSYVGTP